MDSFAHVRLLSPIINFLSSGKKRILTWTCDHALSKHIKNPSLFNILDFETLSPMISNVYQSSQQTWPFFFHHFMYILVVKFV